MIPWEVVPKNLHEIRWHLVGPNEDVRGSRLCDKGGELA
jgi:hypothetical protein